jgi:hypothetical protein
MFCSVVTVCVVAGAVVLCPASAQSAPAEPAPDSAPQWIQLIPEVVFLCTKLTVSVPNDGSHHTWVTVDWGDGTPAEEFRWRSCEGGSRCTPLHEYVSAGEYPVVARISYLDCCGRPCYERTATYQAVINEPNPVEQSTWGAVKALYR